MSDSTPFLKKSVPLWVIAIVMVLSAGVLVAAVNFGSVSPEKLSLYSASSSPSSFKVSQYAVTFQSYNVMTANVLLTNTDNAASHQANVTLTMLDSSGNVITTTSQLTSSIAPGATSSLDFVFSKTNITLSYNSAFISISG